MTEITSIDWLREQTGKEIAVSDWVEVTQARINQFADATDDHQWIHVDPARAAAESPFGGPVAHGFLTLSLITTLARNAMHAPALAMAMNRGFDRVRFTAPVPAGCRVRGRFTPGVVEDVRGGVQVLWNIVVEREGEEKPCCVADWLVRYFLGATLPRL